MFPIYKAHTMSEEQERSIIRRMLEEAFRLQEEQPHLPREVLVDRIYALWPLWYEEAVHNRLKTDRSYMPALNVDILSDDPKERARQLE